jgi:hypothetical protein
MTSDLGLMAFVGAALFHAATHVAVHDATTKLVQFIYRPERLRNSEVRDAIEKAISVAVRKLRSKYEKQHPHDMHASAAFDALKNLKLDLSKTIEANPELWLSAEYVSEHMKRTLDDCLPDASCDVQRFIENEFPPLFVFAFREIGLKANEKVRAVIFESMLHYLVNSNTTLQSQIVGSHEELEAKLQDLGFDISSGLDRVDESNKRLQALLVSSDETLHAGLQDLGYDMSSVRITVEELLDELRGFKVLINREHLGDGPVVAYVRVDDPHGQTLRTEPIRKRKFSIGRGGRDRGIAVNLDDTKVSRTHAVVILDDSGFVIEDAKSTHGTFIQGQKLEGLQRLDFGTAIQIGPFQLNILARDASAGQLLTPATK